MNMRYVGHKASSAGAKHGLVVPSMVMHNHTSYLGEVEVALRVLQSIRLVLVDV